MPIKEERRLRVGVLGCGPIAQAAHFESCTKARNADLYAICDVAEDLRERMAATHRPQCSYGDYAAKAGHIRMFSSRKRSMNSLPCTPNNKNGEPFCKSKP